MANIGEIIDGKYEILREIGRGGMSVVYLAMDKRLNKQWAVKEFRKDKDDASKQLALKALLDEANLMKKLDHPTLPRIVDIIDDRTTVYIIMDYIEGESLDKVLAATGAQPQEAVIEWAKQLSAVLDYLHTQTPPVIYRDMKPSNIMLKPDNTVRLIDFGIAREYKQGKQGDTEYVGTRGYAAPEQFGGQGQTDARTDIYSLGVTLYHLVTGKSPAEPPYEIRPIRELNPALSSGLEWLITKCTQLNPDDRYQSCAEVSYVLNNLDKFEVQYKKSQRSRINLFLAMVICTAVFAISSVGCFLGAENVLSNSYDGYIAQGTIDGYSAAISVDSTQGIAYTLLADKLREIEVVHAGAATEGEHLPANELYEQQILTWFSNDHMEKLKAADLQAYVSVNYELGRLFWNCYQGSSGSPDEAAFVANKYFAEVINNASDDPNHAGLSSQKYNLAKSYYLVSYFQNRRVDLNNQDDGDFKVDATAQAAGIQAQEDGTLSNPYYSYWQTCVSLLDSLGDGSKDINEKVRLRSMERLAYILSENYATFYDQTRGKDERVDGDAMIAFYRSFAHALDVVTPTEDNQSQIVGIRESLNRTGKMISAKYGIELEEI